MVLCEGNMHNQTNVQNLCNQNLLKDRANYENEFIGRNESFTLSTLAFIR